MRGLFSLVGLLVVLAIVGLVARQQLGANGAAHKAAPSSSSSSHVVDALSGISPQVDTPQQRKQLQNQVQDDVNKLMQNRTSELDQQAEPKP